MSSPNLVIIGAAGRMGHALQSAADELSLPVVASLDQGDDLAAGIAQADVVVDFSYHTVTPEVIAACATHGKALVIGTTGHGSAEKAKLLTAAAQTPTVWAGNYSVGVNLLYALTRRAASVLGKDYNAEVTEIHHRFKKDAPSGTAARILAMSWVSTPPCSQVWASGWKLLTARPIGEFLREVRCAPRSGSSINRQASTICSTFWV